jgi:hypothetical protein
MYQLGLPGDASTFLIEQIGCRRKVGCPDDLLLFFGQVSRKALYPIRAHPDAAVRDLDVGKDVCNGKLVQLVL